MKTVDMQPQMSKLEAYNKQSQVGPSSNLYHPQPYEQRFVRLPLSNPSCAINGDLLLWETLLLNDQLEFMLDAPTSATRYERVPKEAEQAIHAVQVGACFFTAPINHRHSGC